MVLTTSPTNGTTYKPMSQLQFFVVALAIIFIVTSLINEKRKKPTGPLTLKRKQLLTNREQQMFSVLSSALPECVVLAQVSFSALVTAEGWQSRNRFNRKVADFVLCSKQMNVIAVIELDDRSHIGREHQDRERDAMLKQAGYTTIRYPSIPTTEQIRRDIEDQLMAMHNARYG